MNSNLTNRETAIRNLTIEVRGLHYQSANAVKTFAREDWDGFYPVVNANGIITGEIVYADQPGDYYVTDDYRAAIMKSDVTSKMKIDREQGIVSGVRKLGGTDSGLEIDDVTFNGTLENGNLSFRVYYNDEFVAKETVTGEMNYRSNVRGMIETITIYHDYDYCDDDGNVIESARVEYNYKG